VRKIAFNADRLDASMVLDSPDYLAIAMRRLLDISQA
jgi:Ala-tRNA(Pro) deacylase